MALDTSIVRSQARATAQAGCYGVARSPRSAEKSQIRCAQMPTASERDNRAVGLAIESASWDMELSNPVLKCPAEVLLSVFLTFEPGASQGPNYR